MWRKYQPVADKVPDPTHFLLIRLINLSGARLRLCITNHLLMRCLCHYCLLHPRLSRHATHQSQSVALTRSLMIKACCTITGSLLMRGKCKRIYGWTKRWHLLTRCRVLHLARRGRMVNMSLLHETNCSVTVQLVNTTNSHSLHIMNMATKHCSSLPLHLVNAAGKQHSFWWK